MRKAYFREIFQLFSGCEKVEREKNENNFLGERLKENEAAL